MEVVVKPYLFLRPAFGAKKVVIDLPEEANVQELLQVLRCDYGMPEKLNVAGGQLIFMDGDKPVGLTILVNGYNIKQLQGVYTTLNDGAVISLFPPAAGG